MIEVIERPTHLEVLESGSPTVLEIISSEETTVIEVEKIGPQGPPGAGGTLVFETPSGAINGVNANFSTAQNFNDIAVYLNGLRLTGSGNDYTVTGANSFTMTDAPLTGDNLAVEYTTE